MARCPKPDRRSWRALPREGIEFVALTGPGALQPFNAIAVGSAGAIIGPATEITPDTFLESFLPLAGVPPPFVVAPDPRSV